jgi:hypothetical protein
MDHRTIPWWRCSNLSSKLLFLALFYLFKKILEWSWESSLCLIFWLQIVSS